MHKKVLILGIFCFFAFSLLACRQVTSTVLQDTACAPPCWKLIYPGQTTSQDVLTALQTAPEVKVNSIREGFDQDIYWSFTGAVGDYGGRIYFQNSKVSVIGFLHKEEVITISDAIQKLGTPENVLALFGHGERTWLSIYLLYPSKGYALLTNIVPFRKGDRAEIKPEHAVNDTWYFDPVLFETVMVAGPIDLMDPILLQKGLRPWTGFGEIEYIDR